MRILYWFRNDLRLHDNEGFLKATGQADEVIPVYCFDPRQFRLLPEFGFHKTGPFRAQFILESVADLRQQFRQSGGDLLIRSGQPDRILAELARELGADAIYASKEVTQEETDLEASLTKRLKADNIDVSLFWVSTLYHVRDLPFSLVKLPDIFTEFRKQLEQSVPVRSSLPAPEVIRVPAELDAGELPTLADLGFPAHRSADERAALQFRGGETAALTRLESYFWQNHRLRTYKETRNQMLGEGFSSKFSAWLSLGCLSPRFVYEEVKRYEQERVANESTYWIIFELLWRDYFRFVALKYGTRIFKPGGIRHNLHRQYSDDPALFGKWINGQTGIPFIDANMRELALTGFMSNRGRQNVSSFMVRDLNLNWTMGAAYFESMLIDYDVCSNWGNWNYMAGVGNDPRENRYFNIYSQALRYDEQGDYVRHWLPELRNVPTDRIHRVWTLTPDEQKQCGVRLGIDYPLPTIHADKWIRNEKIR